MKSKILFVCILAFLILGIINPVCSYAEPPIIKDLAVETDGNQVKISITASQTLQIETFQNEENSANYIVLDFLGTVYTKLPSSIDIDNGAVERVSLVKGDEKPLEILGDGFYALDFLAINLNTQANYQVNQSKSVIDLNIVSKINDTQTQEAVDLTPPIVVSKEKPLALKDKQENLREKEILKESKTKEISSDIAKSKERKERTLSKRKKRTLSKSKRSNKTKLTSATKKSLKTKKRKAIPEGEEDITLKGSKPQVKKRGFFSAIFGGTKKSKARSKRKKIRTQVSTEPEAEKEIPEIKDNKISRTDDDYLIDKIVKETIREKEQAVNRIESLSDQLKRLEKELSLSKGKKSEIEQKIEEILGKLDELKDALDNEISRRRALGEKVDDLIAKKEEYIKSKNEYESLSGEFNRISESVLTLTQEMGRLENELNTARNEKKEIELKIDDVQNNYTKMQNKYDKLAESKDKYTSRVEELKQEIEKLRLQLEDAIKEKTELIAQLRNLERQAKYGEAEFERLKQLLIEKSDLVLNLAREYDNLKIKLDTATSEKLKIEYSYRNAKTEYDALKKEIETYLQEKE